MTRARDIANFGDGIATADIDDGAVTAAKIGSLPAGSVLQVVQGLSTSQQSTTSSSFVDTGLSATITPTSSTSKILAIVAHPSIGVVDTTSAGNRVYLRLQRDGVSIHGMTALGAYNNNNQRATESVTTAYLDSPATNLSVTYTTQFRNDGGGENIRVNWNAQDLTPNVASSITLMEIAQ